MNTLYYGDNLNILREYIADESVDLSTSTRSSIPTATTTFCSKTKAAPIVVNVMRDSEPTSTLLSGRLRVAQ